MRALFLAYSGERLRFGDYPEPDAPGPGQVRFRVREGGICGTDRSLVSTRFGVPPAGDDMLILGHEAVGIVSSVGADVEGLREGDWVVPMVRRDCSLHCAMCARGRRDNCLTGAYVERGITGAHGYFRELAIDDARDLIVVPETLAEVAVLVEPASVVEKAWEVARTLHQGEPRTALILGAGTIGILAAWWAQRLGFETSVYSLEPPHSARARLLTSHGVQYLPSFPAARFDIIMEACGDSAMAAASLSALAHCGVQIVLGARGANVAMPYLDLILRNQIIAGCVNASRAHFANAVVQLGRLHRRQLDPLIRRSGFHSIPESITHPSADVIKAVHVVSEG